MRCKRDDARVPIEFRPAAAADEPFLAEMLLLAAGWREGAPAAPAPELERYTRGFGRAGDAGVVAARRGVPVGAAWCRRFDRADAGYGFVSEDVPELAVAVRPEARGAGVGTALLTRLLAQVGAISLNVEPDNPAQRLYARLGFVVISAEQGLTMLRVDRFGAQE
jgi:ribosomal protein S18 acetylase RimI-like enzyme